MKRHWSKFYWADYETDKGLRQCSLASQGLWMRMLCICAKGDPIGYLTIGGEPLDVQGIARDVGVPEAEVVPLVAELERWGVFSRDATGRIYSRRIVRDEEQANIARKNGNQGGNPKLKPPLNPPDKPSLASSSWTLAYLEKKFDEFLKAYPRRGGRNPRKPALDSFGKAVRGGADPDSIIAGAQRYAEAEAKNIGTPYIAQAVTWLNQHCWQDYANGSAGEPTAEDRERAWAIKCERAHREQKPEGAWGVPREYIDKWKTTQLSKAG